MRTFFILAIVICFIFCTCSKPQIDTPTRSAINEPPTIKLLTTVRTGPYHPYEELHVRAMMTDIDLIAVSSWEAIDAAPVCGINPYFGEFKPMTYEYELEFSFTIPPFFPGNHIIRLYGVDAAGNIAGVDIPYIATN